MIVVDTSVWIDFFRGRDKPLCGHMAALLDADQVAVPLPVRLEILGGCRKTDFRRLKRLLGALPVLRPAASSWARIESWLERTVAAGQHFGVVDLLVAALAIENDASIWSLDGDFARLSSLGFVRVHEPGAEIR